MNEICIKRGSSLNLLLQFASNGVAIDLTNMVLASDVRDPQGDLVATLSLVKLPTIGFATVTVLDTSLWPTGRLRCDLTASFNGQTQYSQTFAIAVQRSVTHS